MKRCFCVALILALLGTTALGSAFAEPAEIVSECVEAEVEPASFTGDTGLTVEGMEIAPEQTPGEAVEQLLLGEVLTDLEAAPAPEEPTEESLLEAAVLAPENGEAPQDEPAEVAAPLAATAIRLSADSITIGVKEKYHGLTASALPEGSPLPVVSWRSANSKYVRVDATTGVITGVKKGSATVYAKMDGGEEVACKVTVKSAPNKLTVKSSQITLGVGMTTGLPAAVPSGSASGAFSYESSNVGVVAVNEAGLVTATGAGSATVTVKTYNGKSAKCKIKVLPAPASIVFTCGTLALAVDQQTRLNPTAFSADGKQTVAAVTYAVDPGSQDAGCIQVDSASGTITGVRRGQAVVNATTHNGVVASCAVIVAPAPKAVELSASTLSLGVGEVSNQLIATTVAPDGEDTCSNVVKWSSSNKKVARVDASTGAITGVKKGSCTVTVKTSNGKTAKCKITVKKAPGKITLSPKNGVLTVGTYGRYKVTLPKGTCGSVTYKSSDPSIATVDETGYVVGVAAGMTDIIATTYNGKSCRVSLRVKPANATAPSDEGGDSEITEFKAGMTNAEKLEYVIYAAQGKLGKPYVYGSFGPNSFDCSGFTTYCFRQIKVELKHSAYTQGYDGSMRQLEMSELKRGDLVFFDTVSDDDLSDHSGLYLGGGKFIHASSSAGKVIVSTLASGYYNRVFSWGRRVLE